MNGCISYIKIFVSTYTYTPQCKNFQLSLYDSFAISITLTQAFINAVSYDLAIYFFLLFLNSPIPQFKPVSISFISHEAMVVEFSLQAGPLTGEFGSLQHRSDF